jgi:flagellar basal body-associated protein FliL
MEDLIAAFGASVVVILIVMIFLPQIITTMIMSYKGYSGCLWFVVSLFLSWIGVIIALCMPNVKRQKEQHQEMIAAITSQNRSQTVILNNQEKQQTQQASSSSSANDFRLQAIRNLKATGNPFDDYDLEIEMERIKNEKEEIRFKEEEEREREKRERQAEQARVEKDELEKQEIENKKKQKILIQISIVIGAILSLTALILLLVSVNKSKPNQYNNTAFETATNTYEIDNIETLLTRLVFKWNDAHSLNSVDMFADLYHWEVFFYGTNLDRDVVCRKKLSSLQKYVDFEQEIYSGINVSYIYDNEYRCDFVKHVTANEKTNDYPSYLVFRKINNDWKIVTESDKITDKNLKRKKSKV